MATVLIPPAIRSKVAGKKQASVSAAHAAELIKVFAQHPPDLVAPNVSENSELKRFLSVFIEKKEMMNLKGYETSISKGSGVCISIAVAGG